MQSLSPKPLLLVQQVSTGHPGRLGEKLKAQGYTLVRCCPLAGERLPTRLEDYAGAVVLGGPMSANDDITLLGLRAQLDWIPTMLASGKPFLGICLGAQLLARALGARVAPHPEGFAEIGYFPVHPTAAGVDLLGSRCTSISGIKKDLSYRQGQFCSPRVSGFPTRRFVTGRTLMGFSFTRRSLP